MSIVKQSSRLLRRVRAVLIDLSGTVHIEDLVIPGSRAAFKRLREAGIAVRFVSNSTKEPHRVLFEKLIGFKFDITRNDIFTSLTSARKYVEGRDLRPILFLEELAKEDFEGISQENPNAVVVGAAPSCFTYQKMNDAFRLLLNGAALVASHRSRYYRNKEGLCLGPGAYVAALEYATEVEAVVIGKPEPQFFQSAIKDMGCVFKDTVMIGDDVRDDVGGAMALGMMGILVQTGKYLDGDENKIIPPPTATCSDFAEAVDLILKNNSSFDNGIK